LTNRIFAEGDWGALAADQGIVHLLSPCCRRLSARTESGVVCGLCSTPLPNIYSVAVGYREPLAASVLTVLLEEVTGQDWSIGFAQRVLSKVGSMMRHPSRNNGRLPE
jgi:hypothetical protein